MDIKVKIYSCYELTYTRVYKDIIHRLYPDFDVDLTILKIEDISDNGSRSIQSQRSLSNYVTRTVRIYEDDVLKHIVGMTNTNFDLDKKREKDLDPTKKYVYGEKAYHANTYLKQGSPAIFNYYFDEKRINPDIDLSFYLLDIDQTYPHNLFNILSYRELQTIGFKVLNIDEVDFSKYCETGCVLVNNTNIRFSSFNKYMNDIALISKRNSGNIPSYLQCQEHLVTSEDNTETYYTDKYIYTFKSLSAQGYDSLFRTWCMKVLADEEGTDIEFRLGKQFFHYDAEEMSVADRLTGPILKTFENAEIVIEYVTNDEFLRERHMEEDAYLSAKNRNDPRNQNLFRNNIRRKGVPCRCVVCGNDNPNILKAAHLWEVSSIKNANANIINSFLRVNSLLELIDQTSTHKNELFFKKYCLTNSGDNGIWLCANHHDLFDQNYFYFESDCGTIVLHFEDEAQATRFLTETVEDCKIPVEVFNRATKAFVAQRNICFGN
jgi:hypothetical protein